MARIPVLQITLCVLALSLLLNQADAAHYGPSCSWRKNYAWKECTWKRADGRDEGVIGECEFKKCYSDSSLHVYYSGNIRISGCDRCCNRWYFTFNGQECQSPGSIDAALYQAHAGNLIKHEHGHIEGYCGGIKKGNVKVEVRVGSCTGTGQALGNAYTGFATTSRIFIEELTAPEN